jgi:hypothetical protein
METTKEIKHSAVSWSASDISSYMEAMEGYDELPTYMLHEDFFLGILEDVLDNYSDAIIEKINFCILEYLSDYRDEIIKEIKEQLS